MYYRDWRDESNYRSIQMDHREIAAWEFLRRNPEYISEWNELLKLESRKYNVPTSPETIFAKGARAKWKLFYECYINPYLDNPYQDPYNNLMILFSHFGYFYYENQLKFLPKLIKTKVLIVVDLALPIPQQMEYFSRLLTEEQKHKECYEDLDVRRIKNHEALWILYLRTLDALNSKASRKDMIQVLFKSVSENKEHDVNKKLSDTIKRAKRLVNGRYLDILIEPSAMKKRTMK